MKESAVAMGFKALASRIHGQLPLSPKESQRLLTALTTSFREHLDKAHPSTADDHTLRSSPNAQPASSKAGKAAMHSSASYADQHISNVLTMFGRKAQLPPKDNRAAKAKMELLNGADPLALLEEYEEKGFATVDIASFCLGAFKDSLKDKPYAEQAKIVQDRHAGSRSLGWLWHSERFKTGEFVDHQSFLSLLVWHLIAEGREQFLWDWMQLDMRLASDNKGAEFKDAAQRSLYEYRWKGRLLRMMVRAALGPPYEEAKSADAALKTYLKAVEWRKVASQDNSCLRYISLRSSRTEILNAFANPDQSWEHTNPVLVERLLMPIKGMKANFRADAIRAAFEVFNPVDPDATFALHFLRRVFEENEPSYGVVFRRHSLHSGRRGDALQQQQFMAATAGLLDATGEATGASWVQEKLLEEFPTDHDFLQDLISKWKRHFSDRQSTLFKEQKRHRDESRPSSISEFNPALV